MEFASTIRFSARAGRVFFFLFVVLGVLSLSAHAKLGQYGTGTSRQSIFAKNIKISTDRYKSVAVDFANPGTDASATTELISTGLTTPTRRLRALDEPAQSLSPSPRFLASNLWRRPPPSF
jgi:hypothetical protein